MITPKFGLVHALALAAVLSIVSPLSAAARKKPGDSAPKADVATQLRAEWKIGDLKLQKEAIDDASFAADVKQNAMSAVDWFLQQQESLISQAQQSKNPAAARNQRSQLEAQFRQKMAPIYNNPALMAELDRRMKALNKEMDTMAASADQLFKKLDSVGLTAAQKTKIRPIVQQANSDLKRTAAKAPSKSHRDDAVKDEAVTKYKQARAKIKQQLTAAQRAKLAKAEE